MNHPQITLERTLKSDSPLKQAEGASAPSTPIYFEGFNTLRFYAALSVVVQHVSYSPRDWFRVPLLPETLERLFLSGGDAVNLFFVLSGFLITYLLLAEADRNGKVSIRNFYIRRAFRIYPVYFVYLLVVLVVLRPPYPSALFILLTFFLGNVAFPLYFPFPPMDHLWSIGTEEQYYLLAPVMARLRNRMPALLIGIIAVWWTFLLYLTVTPPTSLTAFALMSRYDLIALGALAACGTYRQWRVMRVFGHPLTMILSGALIVHAAVFGSYSEGFFYTTVLGIAYAVLIYQVATSKKLPAILRSRRLDDLGKLSYSMYVYHPLFVLLFFSLFYQRLPLTTYQLVAYPTIIALTLFTSWFSYKFLEAPMLRFKDRFKRV